jgi:hypothetical protein
MRHKIVLVGNLLCLALTVAAGAFDDNATAFTIVTHPLSQTTLDNHTRTIRSANRPNADGQPTLVYVGFYVESVGALDCIKNVCVLFRDIITRKILSFSASNLTYICV